MPQNKMKAVGYFGEKMIQKNKNAWYALLFRTIAIHSSDAIQTHKKVCFLFFFFFKTQY